MDLQLTNKTALITGASKGIGLACALRLAEEGCNLRLVARTENDLKNARKQILEKHNTDVQIFAVDLSNGEAARELLAANRDIDILINNAGAIPSGAINQIDEDAWREAWDLKVFGYINTCREAFKFMKLRGHGVVLNIIGAGGERPTPGYVVGAAGNAALMAMTRALGSTSLKYGVRVLGLNPGLIKTDRLEFLLRSAAARKYADESRWEEFFEPDFKPGEPDQIADMTALLVSNLSAFTTGTIVTVDGGASARFA